MTAGRAVTPAHWRRTALAFAATAFGATATLFAFTAAIDPWDVLPLHAPIPRSPITTDLRLTAAALARGPAFDSAVIGTSTARLLPPAELNRRFPGHRFVNLAINSATPAEMTAILATFLGAHPAPHALLIGLDMYWCGAADAPPPAAFPAWMHAGNAWRRYRHMLTPAAIQAAAAQAAVATGLRRPPHGPDGYTSLVPPESEWDAARADAAFTRMLAPPAIDPTPAEPGNPMPLPGLARLDAALPPLPPETRLVLFFPPMHTDWMGPPGSRTEARWTACKARAATLAARHGAALLDMAVPSPLTTDRANYWDPVHYRANVAAALADRLAAAASSGPTPSAPPAAASAQPPAARPAATGSPPAPAISAPR